jgi:uncharacterized tellurite resistance protein B-like protein
MNRLEQLTNLLVMAVADGSFAEREFKFLISRSVRWGITEAEFSRALDYACSKTAALKIPPGKEDRVVLLRDLIRTMGADGNLSDVEKQLFSVAAARMDLSHDELTEIIDSVVKPG